MILNRSGVAVSSADSASIEILYSHTHPSVHAMKRMQFNTLYLVGQKSCAVSPSETHTVLRTTYIPGPLRIQLALACQSRNNVFN